MWGSADSYLENCKKEREILEKVILNGNDELLKELIEDKNSTIKVLRKLYDDATKEIRRLMNEIEGK